MRPSQQGCKIFVKEKWDWSKSADSAAINYVPSDDVDEEEAVDQIGNSPQHDSIDE